MKNENIIILILLILIIVVPICWFGIRNRKARNRNRNRHHDRHGQRSKFDDNNSVSSKSSLFVPELQVNSVCLIEGKEIEVEEQKKQKELAPESKIKTNRLQAINMMTAISCSSLTPSLVSLSKSIV